jgi:hypothetical protein
MKMSEKQEMIQRGSKGIPHHREHGKDGTENNRGIIKKSLRNGKVINHRRRIPVGIQVVVSSLEWHRICPDLVQDSRQIFRIGGYSGFIFGNGDVRHLQLLPSLFVICLEYLIERLFKGLLSVSTTKP